MTKLDPAILLGVELFAGLDMRALEETVQRGRSRRIPRGSLVFRHGEKAVACHVLVSGRVRISSSLVDAGNVVIRFIGPGEMFGALAMFYDGAYPADATAVEDCVELRWSATTMTELMHRHPAIAINALRIVGRRLKEVQERLRESTSERVEQRVARALVRLARQSGRSSDRGIEIGFPLSRKDLAAMTGTGHYTVSRILSDWQQRGLLVGERKRITIRDLEALEALASGQ